MTIYYCNNFRAGLKVIFENKPHLIESSEFIKPGKGQSFTRIKMRCLLNSVLIEKIFKSTDYLKKANIHETCLLFLYQEENIYYFMHPKTFEQYVINKQIIGNIYKWLIINTNYMAILWNSSIIKIVLPRFIIIKIIDVGPNIKKEKISNSSKIATLVTGTTIKVPTFIKKGEKIKIDTKSGQYVSRIK